MKLEHSLSSHCSTKLEPINPAPPVTRIVSACIASQLSCIFVDLSGFTGEFWEYGRVRHQLVCEDADNARACTSVPHLGNLFLASHRKLPFNRLANAGAACAGENVGAEFDGDRPFRVIAHRDAWNS